MPLFSIRVPNEAVPVAEFVSSNTAEIFSIMQWHDCRHADIFRDGNYFLSVRLGENEVWALYTDDKPATLLTIVNADRGQMQLGGALR